MKKIPRRLAPTQVPLDKKQQIRAVVAPYMLLILTSPILVFSMFSPTYPPNETEQGQYTSIVSIENSVSGKHICSGVIISRRLILSAAHCFRDRNDPERIVIRAGSVNKRRSGLKFDANRIILHEDYFAQRLYSDIAIIQLTQSLPFDDDVISPLQLPPPATHLPSGGIVTEIGWADEVNNEKYAASDVLLYMKRQVITDKECSNRLGVTVNDTQMCAINTMTDVQCIGDAGSPLIWNNITVGMVTWGESCSLTHPDIFLRISTFVPWIKHKSSFLE